MTLFTFEFPESIRDVLQDAKAVESVRHCNSAEGFMELYRGDAGRFIVHILQDRESPLPSVRVLKLPDDVSDAESAKYAQAHPHAFSQWEYMVQA